MKVFEDLEIPLEDQDTIVQGAKDLILQLKVDWSPDLVRDKVFSDGITNVLVGIYQEGKKEDMVLVRIYGNNTDKIVDRKAEIENMQLFEQHGCGPGLLASFKNGLAYAFVPGTIPTPEMIIQEEVNQPVIEMLAKMHLMRTGGKPCMWNRLRKFLQALPDNFDHDPEKKKKFVEYGLMSKDALEKEVDFLEQELGNCKSPVVFCHNDLLLGNIVYNPEKPEGRKVTFIDYEYGAQNYQALDIGNHFAEFVGVSEQMDYDKWYPKKDFQLDWIRRYLQAFYQGQEPTEEQVHQTYVLVNKFSLCANLMWGIWSLVQAHNSSLDFDFLDYARQRLGEYLRRKPEFLALE